MLQVCCRAGELPTCCAPATCSHTPAHPLSCSPQEVIVANTIPVPPEHQFPELTVLSGEHEHLVPPCATRSHLPTCQCTAHAVVRASCLPARNSQRWCRCISSPLSTLLTLLRHLRRALLCSAVANLLGEAIWRVYNATSVAAIRE